MLKITLTKSPIGNTPKNRRTVQALGLGKMNSSVVQEDNQVIRGMIHAVQHLVTVESIDDAEKARKRQGKKAGEEKPVKKTKAKKGTGRRAAAKTDDKKAVAKPAKKATPKKAAAKKAAPEKATEKAAEKAPTKAADKKASETTKKAKAPAKAKKEESSE